MDRRAPRVDVDLRAVEHPGRGLTEGTADVSVLRRPISDPRVGTAAVGVERRLAALAADDVLAARRSLRLEDFAGRTVAVDTLTGTTTEELWPPAATGRRRAPCAAWRIR